MTTKTIVGIMFGGRSTEHEISCRSASFLFRHIDWQHYDVAALAVGKDGKMMAQNVERIRGEDADVVRIDPSETPDPLSLDLACYLTRFSQDLSVNPANDGGSLARPSRISSNDDIVIFSIMHGSYGEDGCWQGCFELANVAYVGPDVLGSAVAMDKVIAKQLAALHAIPIVDYVAFTFEQWELAHEEYLAQVADKLGRHVFVKPARLGSSVGISEVHGSEPDQLRDAILHAFAYDDKILVERAMTVREIEFGALGGYVPDISLPGEVAADSKFYSYESKYIDQNAAKILIPAPLSEEQTRQGREMAAQVFQALSLHGMARIDLFFDEANQQFYFNEANTLPGFTSISQYPMLWRHMGLSNTGLIDRLLELALLRWHRARSLRRSFI